MLIAGLGEVGDEGDDDDDILVVESNLDEICGDVVDAFIVDDCVEEFEMDALITFFEFVACLSDNEIGTALEAAIGTVCSSFLLEASKMSFVSFDSISRD